MKLTVEITDNNSSPNMSDGENPSDGTNLLNSAYEDTENRKISSTKATQPFENIYDKDEYTFWAATVEPQTSIELNFKQLVTFQH